MRTFEIPACKAFQLAERSYEHAELLFKDGESILCFDDVNDLAKKIQHYLANDDERTSIANAGHRIAQNFTLERFIKQILE